MLKAVVTDAVNDGLAGLRPRHTEVAGAMLRRVREAMGMVYGQVQSSRSIVTVQ